MVLLKPTNRFYDTPRFGELQIHVYHKKGVGKRMPRYLLKCGCCHEKAEIYLGDEGLEINGVNGSIKDRREILLPLLLIEQQGKVPIDRRKSNTDAMSCQDASVDDPASGR